jgi:hypothetical protein
MKPLINVWESTKYSEEEEIKARLANGEQPPNVTGSLRTQHIHARVTLQTFVTNEERLKAAIYVILGKLIQDLIKAGVDISACLRRQSLALNPKELLGPTASLTLGPVTIHGAVSTYGDNSDMLLNRTLLALFDVRQSGKKAQDLFQFYQVKLARNTD